MIDKLSEIGLVQNDWIVDTKAHPPIFQVPSPYYYVLLSYVVLCYVMGCYVTWHDMTWHYMVWFLHIHLSLRWKIIYFPKYLTFSCHSHLFKIFLFHYHQLGKISEEEFCLDFHQISPFQVRINYFCFLLNLFCGDFHW